MSHRAPASCAVLMGLVMVLPSASPAALGDLETRLVTGGLPVPLQMIPLDEDRSLVATLGGRVWILNDGELENELFLDLRSRVASGGQGRLEELNFVSRASVDRPLATNFGWKVMEGSHCHDDRRGCGGPVPSCDDPSLALPTLEYPGRNPECAVTGGAVYRGRLVPALYGRYLYADFCSGRIWAVSPEGVPERSQERRQWTSTELLPRLSGINSFGSDAQGELYLLAGDAVHQLVDVSLPAAGLIELDDTALTVAEDVGVALIGVSRLGGSAGEVSVEVAAVAGSATVGEDFEALSTVLTWSDGEGGRKELAVVIFDDPLEEADETFEIELASPSGGAVLGARTRSLVTLSDNEICQSSATTLCLVGGRFAVSLDWRSADAGGPARAVPSGPNAGSFWFFDPDNPEVFVKVLDACIEPFQRFWVFAAGLTNVETGLQVIDTYTDQVRRYDQPLGPAFVAVQDTQAFTTCNAAPP